MVRSSLSQTQINKAVFDISGFSNPDIAAIDRHSRELEQLSRRFSRKFKNSYKENFSFAGWSTSKPLSNTSNAHHPWSVSFMESCFRTGPWTPILKSMGVPLPDFDVPASYAGRINVIQERGFKARVIANPHSGVQVAFRPLHNALSKVLKQLKTDCTFDQESGIHWIFDKLSRGSLMWSIDLSAATDNFPLRLQLAVLRGLGYTRISEFKGVCNMLWEAPWAPNGALSYTKGQPMGLYGSFNLFALTHNLLLASLGGKVDQYRIVGDDLVISDKELAEKYMNVMKDLDVPISWHKSLLGVDEAEFAGHYITPFQVLKPLKFPSALLDPFAYVKVVRAMKCEYPNLVPRKFVKFSSQLVAIPEEYGGAGLNPMGRSMLDRMKNYFTSLEVPNIPNQQGPNTELFLNPLGGGMVPGSLNIVQFLAEQARIVEEKAISRLPLVLQGIARNNPTLLGSLSLQLSDGIGVTGWSTTRTGKVSTSRERIDLAWTRSAKEKKVKPSWLSSWD
jgi:hypothetical protein